MIIIQMIKLAMVTLWQLTLFHKLPRFSCNSKDFCISKQHKTQKATDTMTAAAALQTQPHAEVNQIPPTPATTASRYESVMCRK